MKMTLDELVTQLRAAFGTQLRCVALYGSAASGGGDHIPKKSDYNVLVLVDSLDATTLRAASAAVRAWTDAGNPPPLTMTSREWRSSSDIFPMEYADVLERNKVLFGELPTDIRVSQEHLRLELEHEAMGTLLQLRRSLLAAGNDTKAQLALLEQSVSTVMVIFRAVLRLLGEVPPRENIQLSERVAAVASLDGAAFSRAIRHKRGESTLRTADATQALASYIAGVEAIVHYLDQFKGKQK